MPCNHAFNLSAIEFLIIMLSSIRVLGMAALQLSFDSQAVDCVMLKRCPLLAAARRIAAVSAGRV